MGIRVLTCCQLHVEEVSAAKYLVQSMIYMLPSSNDCFQLGPGLWFGSHVFAKSQLIYLCVLSICLVPGLSSPSYAGCSCKSSSSSAQMLSTLFRVLVLHCCWTDFHWSTDDAQECPCSQRADIPTYPPYEGTAGFRVSSACVLQGLLTAPLAQQALPPSLSLQWC